MQQKKMKKRELPLRTKRPPVPISAPKKRPQVSPPAVHTASKVEQSHSPSPAPAQTYNPQKIMTRFRQLVSALPAASAPIRKNMQNPSQRRDLGRSLRREQTMVDVPLSLVQRGLQTTERLYRIAAVNIVKAGHIRQRSFDTLARSSTPTLDSNSRRIMAKKNVTPIHVRYKQVIAEKKARLKKEAEEVKAEREWKHLDEERECSFRPNLGVSQRIVSKTSRGFDGFLQDLDRWERKRHTEREVEQMERDTRIQAQHPFRPSINKKSKEMVELARRSREDRRGPETVVVTLEEEGEEQQQEQEQQQDFPETRRVLFEDRSVYQ